MARSPLLLPLALSVLARSALAADPPPAPAAAPPPAPLAANAAPKKPAKPLQAVVLPGTRVKRIPGYEKIKPYVPPTEEADPPVEPTEAAVVEVTEPNEALVLRHPWVSPLLGAVVEGARVPVKGVGLHPRTARGCSTRTWYALDPFGYVCSKSVRPTSEPATTDGVLRVAEGEPVPFRYAIVGLKEGETLPMWATLEALRDGSEPERQLARGDTVAIEKTVKHDGASYHVSVEGKVLPVTGTYVLRDISTWHGEVLDEKTTFPFGWITAEPAKVYADPGVGGGKGAKGKAIDVVARRTRVPILEEAGEGGRRMLRIGPGDAARWVRAVDVNEVRRVARPEGITASAQWIDVDLGEQALVAYEGDRPVYATLVSSGRAIPTPRGDYPVWAKVSSITMKSQPYEDKPYFVNKVPWVLFFQAHNAIHGAYWHDRFGVSKSHGCVNVAPLDARHLFEWLTPPLPPAWTGYRARDLLASPTVHVRNSHARKGEIAQERPIGPPDKELEQQKLEEAEERRASAAPTATAEPVAPRGAPSVTPGPRP